MDEKKLKPAALNVLGYMINHGSITGQDAIRDLHTPGRSDSSGTDWRKEHE